MMLLITNWCSQRSFHQIDSIVYFIENGVEPPFMRGIIYQLLGKNRHKFSKQLGNSFYRKKYKFIKEKGASYGEYPKGYNHIDNRHYQAKSGSDSSLPFGFDTFSGSSEDSKGKVVVHPSLSGNKLYNVISKSSMTRNGFSDGTTESSSSETYSTYDSEYIDSIHNTVGDVMDVESEFRDSDKSGYFSDSEGNIISHKIKNKKSAFQINNVRQHNDYQEYAMNTKQQSVINIPFPRLCGGVFSGPNKFVAFFASLYTVATYPGDYGLLFLDSSIQKAQEDREGKRGLKEINDNVGYLVNAPGVPVYNSSVANMHRSTLSRQLSILGKPIKYQSLDRYRATVQFNIQMQSSKFGLLPNIYDGNYQERNRRLYENENEYKRYDYGDFSSSGDEEIFYTNRINNITGKINVLDSQEKAKGHKIHKYFNRKHVEVNKNTRDYKIERKALDDYSEGDYNAEKNSEYKEDVGGFGNIIGEDIFEQKRNYDGRNKDAWSDAQSIGKFSESVDVENNSKAIDKTIISKKSKKVKRRDYNMISGYSQKKDNSIQSNQEDRGYEKERPENVLDVDNYLEGGFEEVPRFYFKNASTKTKNHEAKQTLSIKTEFPNYNLPEATPSNRVNTQIGNLCLLIDASIWDPIVNVDMAKSIIIPRNCSDMKYEEACFRNSEIYRQSGNKKMFFVWHVLGLMYSKDNNSRGGIIDIENPVIRHMIIDIIENAVLERNIEDVVLLSCAFAMSVNDSDNFYYENSVQTCPNGIEFDKSEENYPKSRNQKVNSQEKPSSRYTHFKKLGSHKHKNRKNIIAEQEKQKFFDDRIADHELEEFREKNMLVDVYYENNIAFRLFSNNQLPSIKPNSENKLSKNELEFIRVASIENGTRLYDKIPERALVGGSFGLQAIRISGLSFEILSAIIQYKNLYLEMLISLGLYQLGNKISKTFESQVGGGYQYASNKSVMAKEKHDDLPVTLKDDLSNVIATNYKQEINDGVVPDLRNLGDIFGLDDLINEQNLYNAKNTKVEHDSIYENDGVGSGDIGYTYAQVGKGDHINCFYCNEPVYGLALVCGDCNHGGHIEHVYKWVLVDGKGGKNIIESEFLGIGEGIKCLKLLEVPADGKGYIGVKKRGILCPTGCGCTCLWSVKEEL
ncbi:hypothetical protein BB558_003980 [Smittium angustum]|uniref:Uncharacterized protein n=1 Tax=Smittium angustum TaxID=133377 RepID=A0A2U1J4I7_SMIAN|nr:hypothetical protein BB558_003980 [Smittium angustum]